MEHYLAVRRNYMTVRLPLTSKTLTHASRLRVRRISPMSPPSASGAGQLGTIMVREYSVVKGRDK